MPSRRTSVLRVALVDPSGFSRPYDHELAEALARRGHDVTLWTSAFAHGEAPPARGYRVREHFYGVSNRLPVRSRLRPVAKGVSHALGVARLARRLLAERPDVVHVQWVVLHPLERAVYRRLARRGLRLVFTAHDPAPNPGARARAATVAATARVFPRVLVHSRFGRDVLVERYGIPAERVREVPHGALGYLRELANGQAPLRHEGPLAVLPGIIRSYKGVDVLLAAWPAVRERVPGAALAIAGRPMMDLDALPLAQPGVTALPRFLADAELAALLRRADAVVLPYRAIDSSGVLFAAVAFGTPLVMTDVGGFRELHEEHGIGRLVPAGDPAALAEELARVLADQRLRAELRAASERAAAGPFSWDAAAARTEAVYRELLDA